MKSLSTMAAAAALGIDRKALDNVLAREARSLVVSGRRGRSRRIPTAALEQIAVALILSRDLGVGIARALELAAAIIAAPASSIRAGSLCTVTFEVTRLRHALERAVHEALESIAEPVRGRPRMGHPRRG